MSEEAALRARLAAAEAATQSAEDKIQRVIDLVKRAKADEEQVGAAAEKSLLERNGRV